MSTMRGEGAKEKDFEIKVRLLWVGTYAADFRVVWGQQRRRADGCLVV